MNKFAFYPFKFGFLKIEYNNDFIVLLRRVDEIDEVNNPSILSKKVFLQISQYLDGKRKKFNIPYKLIGTKFQIKVWNELSKIEHGKTVSYKSVAIAIGDHNASRAVGMANNKNPISIIIPCHRVIGKNGKMVGYGGGLEMKCYLLEIEQNKKIP